MSTTKSGVRTFGELSAALQARAGSKSAATQKKAAENDPVPEKDPNEKGQAAIPVDADGKPSKQVTPESKANADGVTKTFTAPAPAKTVSGEEKVAGDLGTKAAKVAAGIKDLAARLTKKAESGGTAEPNMPPNDKKNEGSEGGANKPPSGGSGQPGDPVAKTSGDGAGALPADAAEKKAPAPKADDKGELPADKTNADGKSAADTCPKCSKMMKDCGCKAAEAKAASEDIEPKAEDLMKIASIILSTEEGRSFAQAQIEKKHGADAAADIIKAASLMEQKAEELAALEESGALIAEEMWKSASERERQTIIKLAEVLAAGRESYSTENEKLAYDAGAEAAAQMGDAGMLGQEQPENLDSAIMAALDEMVQKGEIQPEEAAQILEALQGGGAGGEGGMPPGGEELPPGAGGGMPPEGGGGGEEEAGGKEASAKDPSAANAAAIDRLMKKAA